MPVAVWLDTLGHLHDRIAINLPRPLINHWLDPGVTEPNELKPLLLRLRGGELRTWPVGHAVGNARNQRPALIEPMETTEDLKFV
jgi:putative SOS response-associated peptidase YedK